MANPLAHEFFAFLPNRYQKVSISNSLTGLVFVFSNKNLKPEKYGFAGRYFVWGGQGKAVPITESMLIIISVDSEGRNPDFADPKSSTLHDALHDQALFLSLMANRSLG